MATQIEDQATQPVATELTPEQTSQNLGTQPSLLPTLTSADVYAPSNVKQVLSGSTDTYKDMKLGKLEKELAKANAQVESNQVNIMNQPKAMGVLTGEAAHQSALDTARFNAVTGLYNAKLLEKQRKDEEEARKEAERQQFIATYGADPKQRPKGMSKKEFAKALSEGKFSNLLTTDAKIKQAELKEKLNPKGTLTQQAGQALVDAENSFRSFIGKNQGIEGYDQKVSPNLYIQQRQNYVMKGGKAEDFDSQFGSYLSDREKISLGVGGSSSVDQWADLLSKGQATVANVPTNIRDAVIQRVSELGTGVNKQLSDTAITEINQTKAALNALDDLGTKITENQDQLGPITGLEAYNPWSEKRRIQADIDRVRQVVGKALEGGVLRKEDEEKYKKILATITDTPETALYKIEALKSDLQRKIDEYLSLQGGAGRYTGGIQTGADAESLRSKYNY